MTEKRLTRRRLLLGTVAVAGGGLALTWLGEDADEQKLGIVSGTFEPNAYLQILPTGQIVLQVDKFEMGQGVMTGFVTLLAEELGARPEQIITRHAPVHPLFQDPSMMTGGSESMRKRWVVIRQTGAAARQMLIIAAADRWGVSPELVSTTGTAQLLNKQTGERLAYRQVTEAAAERSVPGDVPLKSADQFQWIGKAVNRPDVPAKVTGTALFGIDIVLPGMLIAAVLRPPQIGSQLLGFDVSAAERSEGVYRVFPIHSGIAVVAQSWWHANQALQKIEAEWSETSLVATDVSDIHRLQAEQLDAGELIEARDDGDVEAAFNAAERTLEAEYKLPFLAHATMEPMNATVSLTDDFCEVWTGTQAPDLIREVAAEMTGLRREQIEVHTTFGGGGFGRRVFADYAAEAIAIAKQAGVPVKLVWSREDDMRHDFFRGANLHRTKVALNARNQPIAWRHQIVAANVSKNFMRPVMATLAPEWMPDGVHQGFADFAVNIATRFFGPIQAYEGATSLPYQFENVRVEVANFDTGVPSGIWRAVGNYYNAFVIETLIDELAEQAGQNPFQFRREYLAQDSRHRPVLDLLEKTSNWGNAQDGRYQGMAIHDGYESVVGQVVELSADEKGQLFVDRVICVIDCGVAINPDVVKAQMESGIIFGLTAALYGQIDINAGQVKQSNFHDYQMIRLAESPEIEVHIIEGADKPGGVGEPGTPPLAPALANALFAAKGQRVRELPLNL